MSSFISANGGTARSANFIKKTTSRPGLAAPNTLRAASAMRLFAKFRRCAALVLGPETTKANLLNAKLFRLARAVSSAPLK